MCEICGDGAAHDELFLTLFAIVLAVAVVASVVERISTRRTTVAIIVLCGVAGALVVPVAWNVVARPRSGLEEVGRLLYGGTSSLAIAVVVSIGFASSRRPRTKVKVLHAALQISMAVGYWFLFL